MGCNCGKKSDTVYSVSPPAGRPGEIKYFETTALAQAEIRRAGGGMLRAVSRSRMVASGGTLSG